MKEISKYPFIRQTESKDCGVTCLEMLMRYYHAYASKEIIRNMTSTSKNGTSAYGLLKGGEQLGFQVRALKGDLFSLQTEVLVLPCIAHVIKEEVYHHYILIYKIDPKRKRILIADPASKLSWVPYHMFEKEWTNLILEFRPRQLYQEDNHHVMLQVIWHLLKCHRNMFCFLFLFSIFRVCFTVISSFYFRGVVEMIPMGKGIESQLLLYTLLFGFIFLLREINQWFHSYFMMHWSQKIDYVITVDIYERIISLPYHSFQSHTTSEVMTYFHEISKLKEILICFFGTFLVTSMEGILSLLLLFHISSQFLFMSIIVVLLQGCFYGCKRKIDPKLVRKIQIEEEKLSSYLMESVSGYPTIQGMHLKKRWIYRFQDMYMKFHSNIQKYYQVRMIEQNLIQAFQQLIHLLIIYLGAVEVIHHKITLTSFMFCCTLFENITTPITSNLEFLSHFYETKNAFRQLSFLWKPKEKDGSLQLEQFSTLALKNLSYHYEDDSEILKGIDITFHAQEHVMVYGPSGSGKSTLFRLIMQFYPVANNCIYCNEIEYHQYQKSSYFQHICYLSQQEVLFTATLYDNITLYRIVKQSEFLKACHVCCLDQFINDSKGGCHMLIEENGVNLSGGQRQRIILARALLSPAQLIVIDEGLNQVEVSLERMILQKIFCHYPEKTIIYITHRVQNFDLFPRLIEMKQGRITRDLKKKKPCFT